MIRQTFKKFDEDGDGFVTSKQARHVLQDVLGFSAQKSETTMATYDRKNDGKIVYEDFIEFYSMVEEEYVFTADFRKQTGVVRMLYRLREEARCLFIADSAP